MTRATVQGIDSGPRGERSAHQLRLGARGRLRERPDTRQAAPAGAMPWNALIKLAVPALIAAHIALAAITAAGASVTVDEAGHIASGVAHHQHGTFASYRVNPPLARWIATLPVVAFQSPPAIPPVADEPGRRPEGGYGAALATMLGAGYPSVVFVARLANILWSAVGLWLVFVLGRRAFGVPGALLGATVYAFDPNLLAHAALLTSDTPASVAILASTWALLRYLRAPTLASALACGALLGLAMLTKFSALVLYPAWLGIGIVAALRSTDAPRRRAAHGLVIAITSLIVLDAGYGFVGVGERLESHRFVSATFAGPTSGGAPGNRFAGSLLGRVPVPLPRDYVLGVDLQRRDFEGALRSYLDGRWYGRGFWYYYLYALLLKTPLGVLALALWSAVRAARRAIADHRPAVWRQYLRAPPLLVIPLAFFVFVSSQTGFSHHLRYVLPVLPFLALGVGALGPLLAVRGPRTIIVACLAASVASVVTLVPNQLSFFNSIGGGWKHGDEHLVDSNIDWGQDLGRLARWYRAHRDEVPLHVAYFGGVDPHIVGLEYTLPPLEPTAGRFALSVNFVRGMQFHAVNGAGHRVLVKEGSYAYFQHWEPTERIGTSIRLYEVTESQAAEARRRLALTAPDGL
jgi:4-amino-4-deoxy-L-arabinose transferase-like glycosyltransferase